MLYVLYAMYRTRSRQEGWLSPTERASVSATSLRHIIWLPHESHADMSLPKSKSLRYILASHEYVPGTIAVNVTWMERGFKRIGPKLRPQWWVAWATHPWWYECMKERRFSAYTCNDQSIRIRICRYNIASVAVKPLFQVEYCIWWSSSYIVETRKTWIKRYNYTVCLGA